MPSLVERFRNGWNAFFNNRDPTPYPNIGYSSSMHPDRPRFLLGSEKTIVTAIYNRIAMDVAAAKINHVRTNEDGDFVEVIKGPLNDLLTVEANIDQVSREFIQDIVLTMFEDGTAAVVPVDTSINPNTSSSFDIFSARVGTIVQWYPEHVKVNVYNDRKGRREDILLPKKQVAIINNPLYSIMNEPNSVLKRLIRKLGLLDAIDEQSGSGKLDLIIQLPYVIKTEARRQQAEQRRKDIEMQLAGSKYGIAYTDGTEHITQLNRSVENNLLTQIEYLTKMLYSQLSLSDDILNGTASSESMVNYTNRIVEPILSAITGEMKRKWITKTARTQGQSIMYFMDPFRYCPIDKLADIADRFTRNEIMSSNEFRRKIGYKPSDDPRADKLENKNLNHPEDKPTEESSINADLEIPIDQL